MQSPFANVWPFHCHWRKLTLKTLSGKSSLMTKRKQVLMKAWNFRLSVVVTFNVLFLYSNAKKTLAWNSLNLVLVLWSLHSQILNKTVLLMHAAASSSVPHTKLRWTIRLITLVSLFQSDSICLLPQIQSYLIKMKWNETKTTYRFMSGQRQLIRGCVTSA